MLPLIVGIAGGVICLIVAVMFARDKEDHQSILFVILTLVFAFLTAHASSEMSIGATPDLDFNNHLLTAGRQYVVRSDVVIGKDHYEFIQRPDGSVVSYHTSQDIPTGSHGAFIYTPDGKQKFTPVE